MKKLLFFLLLFITTSAKTQSVFTIGTNTLLAESFDIISKYDTTVLNIGNIKCKHDFVFAKEAKSAISYAAMHGPEGCSAYWMDAKCICTICFRHLRIVETRSIKQMPDPYTEALNNFNSKKK